MSRPFVVANETLSTLEFEDRFEDRTVLHYSNGRSVVFHEVRRKSAPLLQDLEEWYQRLKADSASLDPDLLREGRVYNLDSGERAIENDPSVNCHAYACSFHNIPGLPPRLWLKAEHSDGIPGEHGPLHSLLRSFFTEIGTMPSSYEKSLRYDWSLHDGDLIIYDGKNGYVHSGVVVTVQRPDGAPEKWVRSKIGRLFTLEIPPELMRKIYSYHTIEIWRPLKFNG